MFAVDRGLDLAADDVLRFSQLVDAPVLGLDLVRHIDLVHLLASAVRHVDHVHLLANLVLYVDHAVVLMALPDVIRVAAQLDAMCRALHPRESVHGQLVVNRSHRVVQAAHVAVSAVMPRAVIHLLAMVVEITEEVLPMIDLTEDSLSYD